MLREELTSWYHYTLYNRYIVYIIRSRVYNSHLYPRWLLYRQTCLRTWVVLLGFWTSLPLKVDKVVVQVNVETRPRGEMNLVWTQRADTAALLLNNFPTNILYLIFFMRQKMLKIQRMKKWHLNIIRTWLIHFLLYTVTDTRLKGMNHALCEAAHPLCRQCEVSALTCCRIFILFISYGLHET